MLPQEIKDSLMANWGPKADCMNCYAEVKFIDEISKWECYIYAMNPADDDEIKCLIKPPYADVDACDWSIKELTESYNRNGEYPTIDREYRKKRAAELFKELSI